MTAKSVSSIHIYPIKSLGGISILQVQLTDRGLEHDRRWMLVDEAGRFISQRETPSMASLHCAPMGTGFTVSDTRNREAIVLPWAVNEGKRIKACVWEDEVELLLGSDAMHEWFSDALHRKVRLAFMPDSTVRITDEHFAETPVALNDGFPSLIISQASLDELNTKLEIPVPMERFRPNLVITGGEPFQEDDWKEVSLGTERFTMVKPCARCIIINTDQQNGERSQEPLRTLATYRSVENKVRFGMNATFEGTGAIKVGDPVHVSK